MGSGTQYETALGRIFGYTAVIFAAAVLTAPHVLAAAFCVSLAMGG